MSFPELDVLRRIADSIIQSDPLRSETWDLDLSPCQTIAKRHLAAWSSDVNPIPNPFYFPFDLTLPH